MHSEPRSFDSFPERCDTRYVGIPVSCHLKGEGVPVREGKCRPTNRCFPKSAVELRRRIGTKEISPVELLEACIARIERMNPGGQRGHRDLLRARAPGSQRRGEGGAARRRARPAARPARRHQGPRRDRRPADHLRLAALPRLRPRARQRDGGARARGRRHRRRQDQRARVRRRRQLAQLSCGARPAIPSIPSSIPAAPPAAPPWRSRRDMLPVCTGSDTGGSLRIPAAKCGVVGFRPSPGLVPVERRALGWTPISVVGPMGRTVADTCLLLAAQAAMDDCDPLSYPVDARAFAAPAAARPRLAARRVHRGFRHLPGRRADTQSVPRQDRGDAAPLPVLRGDRLRFRRGRPLLRRDPRAELRGALSRGVREGSRLARSQRARQLRDGREA